MLLLSFTAILQNTKRYLWFLINVSLDVDSIVHQRQNVKPFQKTFFSMSFLTHSDQHTYKQHKRKHDVGEPCHTSSVDVIIMKSTYCDIVHRHQDLKFNSTTAHSFYNFLIFFLKTHNYMLSNKHSNLNVKMCSEYVFLESFVPGYMSAFLKYNHITSILLLTHAMIVAA